MNTSAFDLDNDGQTRRRQQPSSTTSQQSDSEPKAEAKADSSDQPHARKRHYPPRTCRICLEVVQPTFADVNIATGVFMSDPSVTYKSEDGGRLFRPCLCKGSQKYVHEECLNQWRLHNPTNNTAFWQCPTCRYKYRLRRMTWARWIGSTASQITLTVVIFVLATFLLGFVADPIINLYQDPYSTLTGDPLVPVFDNVGPLTWPEHMAKGLAGLGLVGFAKFVFTLGPWNWLNATRGTGLFGGNRGGATGRDRMQQLSWLTIAIGVLAFLWAVWKGVRTWSRRALESASEKVMEVPIPDNDDNDE